MRSSPLRFACVVVFGLSCGAGAISSSSAGEAPQGDDSGAAVALDPKGVSTPDDSVIVLTGPGASAPAALLQTFSQPSAGASLNKPATLSVRGPVRPATADNTKDAAPLSDVQAVAVPEPTALFLAGFAGCVLLALAQRLRGSRA